MITKMLADQSILQMAENRAKCCQRSGLFHSSHSRTGPRDWIRDPNQFTFFLTYPAKHKKHKMIPTKWQYSLPMGFERRNAEGIK